MSVVLGISVALASVRFATALWAAAIVLLTLGLMAVAILAVVYRRGARRAFWLGFALLGWGYLVLASGTWWDINPNRPELATTILLDGLYEKLQPSRAPWNSTSFLGRLFRDPDPRNRQILAALDQPIALSFANPAPLGDVLKYIRTATTGPNGSGMPIHVDPVGLEAASRTLSSPVSIDVEGVPLRVTLGLMLKQLGLTYHVENGLLTITSVADGEETGTSFRRIGHCYCALLAAWIGGIAGRSLFATRDEAPRRGREA